MTEDRQEIRVAIAEDHIILRQGLVELLKNETGLKLVFEAENGAEVLEKMRENPIDVLILDLRMPIMDGETCLPLALELNPELKVVILSMYFTAPFISQLIKLGASAYLPKNIDFDSLKDAIVSVHQSGYYINEEIEKLLAAYKQDSFSALLSERELEIIHLVCKEKTSKEIAIELFLSHRTVEGHKARLIEKINAKNTAGIVLYAIRKGLF
jgi:DNA-binding NarL/FixJ family response regulator